MTKFCISYSVEYSTAYMHYGGGVPVVPLDLPLIVVVDLDQLSPNQLTVVSS